MNLQVAPSILSADFSRLGEQVATVMDVGAKVIHVDVMDGHFVPPITIGPLIVQSLRDQVHQQGGLIEVHLMIERPERHIQAFVEAGADLITVHQEATPNVHYTLKAIHDADCKAGLAINPATPVEMVGEVVDMLDLVLCMTVNPGWGGQPFLGGSFDKVKRLRKLVGPEIEIEVDGGIDTKTIKPCADAGATRFVAGSAIFSQNDPAEEYKKLIQLIS